MAKFLTVWCRFTRFAVLLAACLVICGRVDAGEKILIIEGTDKVEFPDKTYNKDFLSEPFNLMRRESGGRGSLMPILPPPNPKTMRPEKPEEKNWLNPENFDRDAALKQIFKIREYNLEGQEKKQSSSTERFWGKANEPKKNTESTRYSESGDKNANDTLGRVRNGNSYDERREAWAPSTSELDRNGLLLPNQSNSSILGGVLPGQNRDLFNPANNAQIGGIFERIGTAQATKSAERESSLQEFDKLLGRKPVTGQLTDPINFYSDRTRQGVNPVTGSRLESISLSPNAINGSLNSQAAGVPDSRRGLINPFESKVLGVSSLAPAVVIPASSAPAMQPKPPVLEIPRRKF